MLIKSEQKGIHERILTAKNGQLVRVCFAVVEVDGVMRGRVISVTPIVSVAGNTFTAGAEQHFLPISVERDIAAVTESIFTKKQVSPFTSFDFFMSQPTRAPSVK